MYETMLKPLAGQTGVEGDVQFFWMIFAIMGIAAMSGLILYNKFFAADTPETNARARSIMIGVYTTLVVIGLYFVYSSLTNDEISYKTLVQATIMLLIGAGGFYISRRK
jgi:predicted membrane channel-forming protein YqfA (hemolysin III family)